MEGLTNTKGEFQQFKDNFAAVPLGRVGQPDEIAKLAVFLASDDSVAGSPLSLDYPALDLTTWLQQICRARDLDGSAALPMGPLRSARKSML